MKKHLKLTALAAATVLALGACSSGQDNGSSQQAPAPAVAPAVSPVLSAKTVAEAGLNQPLTPAQINVVLTQEGNPVITPDGKNIAVTVGLSNHGQVALISKGKYPVHFGAQRLGANGKADMDLSRAMIPLIDPGSSAQVTIMLPVDKMLNHSAELLPVQEQVAWFDAWGTKPVVVGPFSECTGSMAGKICGPDGKPLATQPAK
ncbi:MAG: hypothetical protein KGO02_05500 [Alphaproteobacteria bacterium]|nr:hypothetical protein [Alphaproteobacteria bacterium]